MLKQKTFWIGFALAYALSIVVPPSKFMKKKS